MPQPIGLPAIEQYTTFGDLLKYLRRRSGMTQRELATAVGYSDTHISRLEQNQRLPDLATVTTRLPKALGIAAEPALVARLAQLAEALRREDAPAPGLPPFKGLYYFDEGDSELFFGRESLTDRLLARLLAVCAPGYAGGRFLAIMGASGSGKSSLVRAGLVPALRWTPTAAGWPIHVITPAAHPLDSLAGPLGTSATAPAGRAPHDWRPAFEALARQADAAHGVLVVDQFEEVFTLCAAEAERAAFVQALHSLAFEPGGTTLVVVVLRADFYAHCARYANLREALAHFQEYIGAMSAAELRRAIEEPARRGRWELEPGLVEVVLHDLGAAEGRQPEPGALPLLAHALLETWHRRRGSRLTVQGYAASGGVRGAIAETAESVFRDQLGPDERVLARRIFLRLTTLGEDETTADTRRRVSAGELLGHQVEAGTLQTVLQSLANARLVTTDQAGIEVAHEALIREWPTLRGWLADDRQGLRLHRHLTESAQAWEQLDRDPGELYRGARLAQAVEWSSQHPGELNALEREFVEASQAAATREQAEREAQLRRELEAANQLALAERRQAELQSEASKRLRVRNRIVAGAGVIALVLAVVAAGFGVAARNAAATSTSRDLARAAEANLVSDPELGLLLALESMRVQPNAPAESILHQGLFALHRRDVVAGHSDAVHAIAVSPAGQRVATASHDNTVKVWALDGPHIAGEAPLVVIDNPLDFRPRRDGSSFSLAYSPDGTLLAGVSGAMTARIWDADTGALLRTLTGHAGSVYSIVFSPDGRQLVTASADGTVRFWDAATGERLLVLEAHEGAVISALLSADGRRMVTASNEDSTVRVWEVGGAGANLNVEEIGRLVDNNGVGVAPSILSPDGQRVAIAAGTEVQVWEVEALRPGAAPSLPVGFAVGALSDFKVLLFSPDGQRLMASTADGHIRIWDAVYGHLTLDLRPAGPIIASGALAPDGQTLFTGTPFNQFMSWDIAHTGNPEWLTVPSPIVAVVANDEVLSIDFGQSPVVLHRWRLEAHGPVKVRSLPLDQPGLLFAVASPDGSRLASVAEGEVWVWDTQTGAVLLKLPPTTTYYIWHVSFSRDNKWLATSHEVESNSGGQAEIWDLATGQRVYTLVGHELRVFATEFSPDGRFIATASRDFTTRLWEASTGELLHVLQGHTAAVFDAAFSPDGRYLATTGPDSTVRVWDVQTGLEEKVFLSSESDGLAEVAFSNDGRLLAASDAAFLDPVTRLWNFATGEALITVPGVSPLFANDGHHLFTLGTRDQMGFGFYLDRDELVQAATAQLRRTLTTAECQEYLHVAACP